MNKISIEIMLTWGVHYLLSFVVPNFYKFMPLPGVIIISNVISVVLLLVAHLLVRKFYVKRPAKIGKLLPLAIILKIAIVLLQILVGRMLGLSYSLLNFISILYVPLCIYLVIRKDAAAVNGNAPEKTTLYRKEPIIAKGSPAEKFMNNVFVYFWAAGAIFTLGGFIVQPRSQAPAFFAIGIAFLAVAFKWTQRKINANKIENYEKIVTPDTWPKDCQFADYNLGLKEKAGVAKKGQNLNFYKKCASENITDLDSARNKQKALLIAQSMKLKDTSEDAIRTAYYAGKSEDKYNASLNKDFETNQKLAKTRIDELNVLAGAMQYYGLHGKEKRIAMLRDMLADARKKYKDAKFMEQYAQRSMLQKEHDWATHGGIASGIAGPAAGLAAAMRVEAKNAAIREYNAQMAPYAAMVSMSYANNAKGFESLMNRYSTDISNTNIKLVADDTTEEVYNHLTISNMNYAISETGAVVVEADFEIDKNYRIFETVEPTIDGIVAARLMENGVHAGSAYFVFPVDGVHKKIRLASICTKTTNPNATYEVEYVPVDLWAMEKLD